MTPLADVQAPPKEAPEKELPVEKVLDIIRPGGQISKHLKGFEARDQQQSMMRDVIDAYNKSEIALIEAGTGTGKSMAYLIPAILWAAKHGERTVISTHTITLQEQLVDKDIPLLLKALGVQVKAVLVKGMGNYVCMRKFDDTAALGALLPEREAFEVSTIEVWLPQSSDGSRASMSIVPSRAVWDKIGAEPDTCNWQKCSHYNQCHFVKARAKAVDAQILVVNHHLLFADLARRAHENNYKDPAVLPAYDHLVIDEAHNIEDVATEYFASRVSRYEAARLMARIASEKTGRLTDLKKALQEGVVNRKKAATGDDLKRIQMRVDIDLPAQRRDVIQRFGDTFESFSTFIASLDAPQQDSEQPPELAESKLRVLPQHHAHPDWKNGIAPQVAGLVNAIGQFAASIISLTVDIEKLPQKDIAEKCRGICYDLTGLTARLANYGSTLHNIANSECPKERVRWIENHPHRHIPNVDLVDAALDISETLREYLFDKFSSVVLCSATMTVDREFSFLRQRLGIDEDVVGDKLVKESSYDSPFAYEKQAMLVVPTDMPAPNESTFLKAAVEGIWDAISASRGNALVLFTSYQMLNTVYNMLNDRMVGEKLVGIKQGEDGRSNLLHRFRTTDRSVLFATYSFWEGVDISGDSLRCVIIVKLPFKVPTEPLIQARTEDIKAQGGDAFMNYSLPLAVVKFKQGFGRLIRHKRDRGCIVCLDSRLITKRYGKQFLNSLPPCQTLFAPSTDTKSAMRDFYRKTHYLTVQA